MTMEYLSALITEEVNLKNRKPFKLKNHNVEISHLLFADDILLFARANESSIYSINTLIDNFCQTSGMEINLEESKLWLSPEIPQNMKTLIFNNPGIPYTSNLGNFLGYQLKTNYNTSYFNNIILQLQQRLHNWKSHHLSFAGRTQLIVDTLNQIPNYQMRVFSLPQKIHKQLDKICRNFLWGHFITEKK